VPRPRTLITGFGASALDDFDIRARDRTLPADWRTQTNVLLADRRGGFPSPWLTWAGALASVASASPHPRRGVAWVLLPALAACAAPPINDLGGGRYHLAVRAEHGVDGLDLDRANALHLADQYCRKSGLRAHSESFDQEGPFKASPAVGVVFSCEPPHPEEMPPHKSDQYTQYSELRYARRPGGLDQGMSTVVVCAAMTAMPVLMGLNFTAGSG